MKRALLVLVAFFILSIAMCHVRTDAVLKELTKIEPVTTPLPDYQATYFYIVGMTKEGPKFVRLSDLSDDHTHPDVETFYIPKADLASVTKQLRDGLTDPTNTIHKIEIVSDDPAARRQRISIDFQSDEFEYFPTYDVDGPRITPVSYGDVTKRKMYLAFKAGLAWFGASMLAGIVAAIIAARFTRSPPRAPHPRS